MKTICVVHGVGFSDEAVRGYADNLQESVDATVMIHAWDHSGVAPSPVRSGACFFGTTRKWLWEILMDYTYALKHIEDIVPTLPQADMYVGYSAGSLLISTLDVPKVYVASPVTLIERVTPLTAEKALNIMHYRDPIAAPMPWAENVVVKDFSVWRFVNPVAAHMECMNNSDVLKHTLRWYEAHVRN